MTKRMQMAAGLVAAIAAAGCADDLPDPKAKVACDFTWNFGVGDCDAACEVKPDDSEVDGPSCETSIDSPFTNPPTFSCPATFASSGQRGCCVPYNQDMHIKPGVDGEPERTRRVFFLTCK